MNSYRFKYLTLMLLCSSAAASAVYTEPSFDCSKTYDRPQRIVCSFSDLSAADAELHGRLLVLATFDPALGPDRPWQGNWIATSRDTCTQQFCMREAYAARLIEVNRRIAAFRQPQSPLKIASTALTPTIENPVVTSRNGKEPQDSPKTILAQTDPDAFVRMSREFDAKLKQMESSFQTMLLVQFFATILVFLLVVLWLLRIKPGLASNTDPEQAVQQSIKQIQYEFDSARTPDA